MVSDKTHVCDESNSKVTAIMVIVTTDFVQCVSAGQRPKAALASINFLQNHLRNFAVNNV